MVPRSPHARTRPVSMASAIPPSLEGPAHPGPGRAEAGWQPMECMFGNVPRKSLLPGQAEAVTTQCVLEAPVGLPPTSGPSSRCCLWPQVDTGPTPEQNPAKQSPGFVLLNVGELG